MTGKTEKRVRSLALGLVVILVLSMGSVLFTGCGKTEAEVPEVTEARAPAAAEAGSGYPDDYQVQFLQTWKKNNDFQGYLTLEGTALATPVVQGKDNTQYREVDFNGNPGRTAFLDYRADVKTPSSQLLIYLPDATDHEMYSELVNYKNLEYYKKHPTVTFNSVYEDAKYKVFAVVLFPSGYEGIPYQSCMESGGEAQVNQLIQKAQEHSILDIPVDVNSSDEILTIMSEDLSLRDENGKYARIQVYARKVRDNESAKVDTAKAELRSNDHLPRNWYDQILRNQFVSTVIEQIRKEAADWFTEFELSQIHDDDLERELTARKTEFAKYLTEQELKLPAEEKVYLYEKRKYEAENPVLKLDMTSLTARVGDKVKLNVTRTPADKDAEYHWKSSDSSVVSVSGKGTSVELSFKKKGNATITVTSGKASATCTIKVEPAKAFVLNPSSMTIVEDGYFHIEASNDIAKGKVSNSSVATLTYNGKYATVTGHKAGETTITLTDKNGASATCKVTVQKATLKLEMTHISLEKGERYNLRVIEGNAANWYVDNNRIAKVKSVGNGNTAQIEAVGTGTTTVTATSRNGAQAQCKITVVDGSIAISQESMELVVGETKGLNVIRGSASNWVSSDESVIQVYPIGDGSYAEVEAVGYGVAYVRAEGSDGSAAVCSVAVASPKDSLSISPYSMTMNKGDMRNITVTAGSATDWISEDPSVAKVYVVGDGSMAQVEAVGEGWTVIKVRDSYGAWIGCEITVNRSASKLQIGPGSLYINQWDWADISVISGTAVDWTSTDPSVVRIYGGSDSSKVSVKGEGPGTAQIIAYAADGSTASCTVTVHPYVDAEPLALNRKSMEVNVGEWYELKVSSGTAVDWDSDNPNVVGVYGVGDDKQTVRIKAEKEGMATITAYAADYSEVYCTVTAVDPYANVKSEPMELSLKHITIEEGSWGEIWVTSGNAVNWNTSNANIVRVYGNDDKNTVRIKAESAGTAEIIAYAADGSTVTCTVTVTPLVFEMVGEPEYFIPEEAEPETVAPEIVEPETVAPDTVDALPGTEEDILE